MTLNTISWTFGSTSYSDAAKFNKEVSDYQKLIHDDESRWKPDEIMCKHPQLKIQYTAWITKPSDLHDNEVLINDDKDVFEKYPDEQEHQVEIVATIKADNGQNISAQEFLMKTHNQQANKELGDHVFFEGIDENPKMINGIQTYFIACGS